MLSLPKCPNVFVCLLVVVVGLFTGNSPLSAEFVPVDIDTVGNPYGYFAMLPEDYGSDHTKVYPLVVFFHGAGRPGDGTIADENGNGLGDDLGRVIGAGAPHSIAGNYNGVGDYLAEQEAIVLCPQYPSSWWSAVGMRAFLDFAKSYYQVDQSRMYFTGLSAGASGVHWFMNEDARSDEVAAFVPCAIRGVLVAGEGDYLGVRSAYWGLSAIGDVGYYAIESADLMANYLLGDGSSDVNAIYPGSDINRTASFEPDSGWVWQEGVVETGDSHIKVTLFTGSSHNSWDRTYRNLNVWRWIFAQVKPRITIVPSMDVQNVAPGSTLQLNASAIDRDGQTLDSSTIQWFDGEGTVIGSGESVTIPNLGLGVHEYYCEITDSYYQLGREWVTVRVNKQTAYTAHFDFGSSSNGYLTTASGWNNITDHYAGTVTNAADSNGEATGITVALTKRFQNKLTSGVVDDSLYPETAQRDVFLINDITSEAQITISKLNPYQAYDFTMFASRKDNATCTAIYTIGDTSVTLNASQNTNEVVTIEDVYSDEAGTIVLDVARETGSSLAYLGVLSIHSDGTGVGPPAVGAVSIHAVGANSGFHVGLSEASAYRSVNVAKTYDSDHDDVYGTEGYLIFGNGASSNLTGQPFSFHVSGGADWVTSYSQGADFNAVAQNKANTRFDNPTLVAGADVVNWLSSAMCNSAIEGSAATWGELMTFTVGVDAPRQFRLGLLTGNPNNTDGRWESSGLRVSFNGGSTETVTGLGVTDLGMVLFDVVLEDGVAGTFSIEGQKRLSTQGPSIGGITFDLYAEPTAYDLWVDGFPSLGDHRPEQDPDRDGVETALEYVLNGDPSLSGDVILPTMDAAGENFVFSFMRNVDASEITTQVFEYCSDLSEDDWTELNITEPKAAEVSLGLAVDGEQPVTITLDKTNEVQGRIFGRLKVVY